MTDDLADAAVETLDHAVGLGVSRRAQAVLYAQGLACQVEYMLTRRRLGGARESVGELAAVVGEDGLIFISATPLSRGRKSVLLLSVWSR